MAAGPNILSTFPDTGDPLAPMLFDLFNEHEDPAIKALAPIFTLQNHLCAAALLAIGAKFTNPDPLVTIFRGAALRWFEAKPRQFEQCMLCFNTAYDTQTPESLFLVQSLYHQVNPYNQGYFSHN